MKKQSVTKNNQCNDYLQSSISINKLTLGNTNEEMINRLTDLMGYVYKQFPIDYKKMSKIYHDVESKMDYDFLDDEKDIHSYIKFNSNFNTDDEYHYKFKKDLDLDDKYSIFEDNNFIREVHRYLMRFGPLLLRMKDIVSITLTNNKDVNSDARGVRALDWKLHFWKSYTICDNDMLTFHDFIIACYKIRSHKFENNYELFCQVDDLNNITVPNNYNQKRCHLFINVSFDHGS